MAAYTMYLRLDSSFKYLESESHPFVLHFKIEATWQDSHSAVVKTHKSKKCWIIHLKLLSSFSLYQFLRVASSWVASWPARLFSACSALALPCQLEPLPCVLGRQSCGLMLVADVVTWGSGWASHSRLDMAELPFNSNLPLAGDFRVLSEDCFRCWWPTGMSAAKIFINRLLGKDASFSLSPASGKRKDRWSDKARAPRLRWGSALQVWQRKGCLLGDTKTRRSCPELWLLQDFPQDCCPHLGAPWTQLFRHAEWQRKGSRVR